MVDGDVRTLALRSGIRLCPGYWQIIGVANEEDRRPRYADSKVANLEGAALPLVGWAGAGDDVAAVGIERRHTHDGGIDRQFLSR